MSNAYDALITQAAKRHNVPFALIKAHMKNESDFNPWTMKGEAHLNDASWGLMQVLLNTARDVSRNPKLTTTELLKPEVNIDIGTRYIRRQLDRYPNSITDAIQAYNAGYARRAIKDGELYNLTKCWVRAGQYINQCYVDRVYRDYLGYSVGGTSGAVVTAGVATGQAFRNISRNPILLLGATFALVMSQAGRKRTT